MDKPLITATAVLAFAMYVMVYGLTLDPIILLLSQNGF